VANKTQEALIDVTFVSEWNHIDLVETKAKFNWNTCEVVDVEPSKAEVEGTITRQYIVLPDGTELELDSEMFEEESDVFVQNEVVLSFNGEDRGYIIGDDDEADCGVESCTGTNYRVYWKDGEISICCGKELSSVAENIYQIM
jgi:hypothetical protein